MINYELKPTFDNLKKTLLEDSIGRNEGIATFIKFLNLTDNNIVIALNDDWGNGKTFFVKQTQMVLQSYDESKDELKDIRQCMSKFFQGNEVKPYFPVYYDAWANDNDEDPVLSIVFTMLQSIGDLKKYEVIDDKNGWDIFTSGLEVLTTTFARTRVKDFLDSLKGKDGLAGIKEIKATEQVLNEIFNVLLKKYPDGTRIVFFIDELDRCCPNFAVRLLERIKHYFLNEKVIFVLSINAMELQHTIKRHYGNDFNADKYLRRFFDFMIPLPAANMQKYHESINFSDKNLKYDVAKAVIQKYHFSLREIGRYLQYLNVAIPERYETGFSPQNFFYFGVLTPFLIGLNIHDLQKYNEFINGKTFKDLIEVIQLGSPDWYCRKFLADDETFEKEQSKRGYRLVSLEEKIRPAYECLFGGGEQNYVTILTQEFSANDKKKILSTISLMQSDKI